MFAPVLVVAVSGGTLIICLHFQSIVCFLFPMLFIFFVGLGERVLGSYFLLVCFSKWLEKCYDPVNPILMSILLSTVLNFTIGL